jgi:sensor c-di-GMP phosphodiesterase-like protein
MLIRIGLLLCGTVLGILVAESIGRIFLLRSGEAELNAYAERLQQTASAISYQTEGVANAVLHDKLPFCSEQELVYMRGLVYQSSEVKDIGRIRGGVFSCSSEVGVISNPFPMPRPTAAFRNMQVYAWIPILSGFGDAAKGFIVQAGQVDIVLNPSAFDALREPSHSFAAFLYDSPTGTLIQAFGQTLPLSKDDVTSGKLLERKGVYYRPLCSARARVCVVAAESHKAILAHSEPIHGILLLAGASLGNTLVLGLLLFYQRHRSQERQLRRAIRRDALTVVYQPIIDLDTFTICGAEALVRWTNEDGEIVSPEVFVALAEDKGFVTGITKLVVRRSLEELGELLVSGDFRLTLNVSSQDLAQPSFAVWLEDSLRGAGVHPYTIGLELTERSTSNQQTAIETIAQLRRAGHRVYIDDFGTGYSSLAYLRDLAVDVIKIDRAFTATVGTHAITECIIPQILQMAEQLHLAVVVEGIETREQADYFRASGRGILGQGWLFSRAVPAADLYTLLDASPDRRLLLAQTAPPVDHSIRPNPAY